MHVLILAVKIVVVVGNNHCLLFLTNSARAMETPLSGKLGDHTPPSAMGDSSGSSLRGGNTIPISKVAMQEIVRISFLYMSLFLSYVLFTVAGINDIQFIMQVMNKVHKSRWR